MSPLLQKRTLLSRIRACCNVDEIMDMDSTLKTLSMQGNLLDLPDEILTSIFSHLHGQDLGKYVTTQAHENEYVPLPKSGLYTD